MSAEIMQQDNKFNKREKREACNSSCSVSKPKPLITIVTSQQSRAKKEREIEKLSGEQLTTQQLGHFTVKRKKYVQ